MVQIAFTGDMAFSKHFSQSCMEPNLLSEKVEKFLSESDYTVINVEGAVSSGDLRSDKPLAHANPYDCLYWIKRINGNIWSLANNHAMDCHREGLMSTLAAAHGNGFQTIGIGENVDDAQEPVIIQEAGGIGIFSVTYNRQNEADDNTPGCLVADDEERIKRLIKTIKEV